MTTRTTPAEIVRRQTWVGYLMKQGYNQAQVAERLGMAPSTIGHDCSVLGVSVRRYRNPDLPMGPVNWREDFPPGLASQGRLARNGVVAECLALLDYLEGKEALFQLATLLEEEELPSDQYGRLLRLQGYLADIGRLARDPQFRKQVRKDPRHRGTGS